MKIVIVGDGKIGSTLAEQLSREGHEVTIIDQNAVPLHQTVEDLDILCVEGNGAMSATQLEAGVDSADLLIAVTASDELNLLCCLVAKKLGARHTIARVRNPEYDEELNLISEDLGLSLSVNPELNCAAEIARTLRTPSAIKTDTFAGGCVEMLKFQLPPDSQLVDKQLMELPGLIKAKVLICAVERGENEVYIPAGTFRLAAGDRISFVASPGNAQQFFRQQKLAAGRIRNALLVCLAVEATGVKRIVATVAQTGQGEVECAHGTLSIPAPATSAIIARGIPVSERTLPGERMTPTSAAMILHFVDEFE